MSFRLWAPALGLLVLACILYGRTLLLPFVGDDFLSLDTALRYPLGELLSGRHGLGGSYRPLSRELYFWWWGRQVGFDAGGFHLVNAATFGAVLAMWFAFVGRWAGPRAGMIAALALILFPAAGALLAWVSNAQDLIALFFGALALLLYQRRLAIPAGIACFLALLSKETSIVLPLALVALEWTQQPRARFHQRLRRLLPTLLATIAAFALQMVVRAAWPPGVAGKLWSPGSLASLWRMPLDFLGSIWPPHTWDGVSGALRASPVQIVAAVVLATLNAAQGGVAAARMGRGQGGRGARAENGGSTRPLVFGLTVFLIGLIPVAASAEPWRDYSFMLSALGGSVALGVFGAQLPRGLVAASAGVLALAHYGGNSVYRPAESASPAARHRHVNITFFEETGRLNAQLLQSLEPWCRSIASLPRTFVAGVPPDPTFLTALGAGRRVACRDTAQRVLFLSEMTPEDAGRPFGILRFDPRTFQFLHERADARVRARTAEGFLLYGRYPIAAALLESALAESAMASADLVRLASILAAEGRLDVAEERLTQARAKLVWPIADEWVARLLAPLSRSRADSAQAATAKIARTLLRDPFLADPHVELGRQLLRLGLAREGALEIAIGFGIGRSSTHLGWLAEAYDALGATDDAREAYREALRGGLPPGLYERARRRFMQLGPEPRGEGGPGGPRFEPERAPAPRGGP